MPPDGDGVASTINRCPPPPWTGVWAPVGLCWATWESKRAASSRGTCRKTFREFLLSRMLLRFGSAVGSAGTFDLMALAAGTGLSHFHRRRLGAGDGFLQGLRGVWGKVGVGEPGPPFRAWVLLLGSFPARWHLPRALFIVQHHKGRETVSEPEDQTTRTPPRLRDCDTDGVTVCPASRRRVSPGRVSHTCAGCVAGWLRALSAGAEVRQRHRGAALLQGPT